MALNQSILEATTEKKMRVKRKDILCPWVNDELKSMSKLKNVLLKKIGICLDDDRKTILNRQLYILSNKITKLKRTLKSQYYHKLFNDCSSSFQVWKNINKVLGKNKASIQIDSITDENKVIITDSQDISEKFNDHFVNVGSKLDAQIPIDYDGINFFNSIKHINDTFFLYPTDTEEIATYITLLESRKSSGPDDIINDILKKNNDIVSPFISKLINIIFETGIYPDLLKLAKVIPIYKHGDKNCLNNYRPISILNSCNKIIEWTIHKRLLNFLEGEFFFYKYQYGFRKKSGTTSAAIEILDSILGSLDKGQVATGIFLDLTKAFDTVNHNILLDKLSSYGIRGVAYELFVNYLNNRTQYVVTNDISSNKRVINCGVPQGSVLGPLLFLIYINDIGNLPIQGSLRLFADDCVIFYFERNININLQNLQYDMNILEKYFKINRLSLNTPKTKFINIRSPQKTIPVFNSPTFMGIQIEQVNEIKYLGLIIDEFLTWQSHISVLRKKLSPIVGILRKLSYFLPQHILLIIYNSLISSHLQYLTIAWGFAAKIYLKKLQVLQNRALKSIFGLPYHFSSNDLYYNTETLPIKGIYCHQICCYVHRVLKNQIYHTIGFDYIYNTHNTRSGNALRIRNYRTNKGLLSISIIGPKLYSYLPLHVINSKVDLFKKRLKFWMLEYDQVSKLTKFSVFS